MNAYFSNGSEAMAFEEQFCSHCVHGQSQDGCPIFDLHFLWNYDQFPDTKTDPVEKAKSETIQTALNWFIPRRVDGFPAECKMFIKTP